MADIKTVGVIGAGQMGSGIAHVCALAGYDVFLHDLSQEKIDAGVATIERNLGDGSLTRIGSGDWDIPLTVELLRRKRRLPEAAEAVWALLAQGAQAPRKPLQSASLALHRPVPTRG